MSVALPRLPVAHGSAFGRARLGAPRAAAEVPLNAPFAVLYVLAITESALLLPSGGAILTAAGACAFYSAEVIRWRPMYVGAPGVALGLQLGVFAAVALGAGLVGARLVGVRLRQAGTGGERLAAALAATQRATPHRNDASRCRPTL